MIEFSSQTEFKLEGAVSKVAWIESVVKKERKILGDLQYVFCSDEFLHGINIQYLNHDTLTDIITFDYTSGDVVSGEVYISIERVKENAESLGNSFEDELDRVIIHGVLHLCGYLDKTAEQKKVMRGKEDACLLVRN